MRAKKGVLAALLSLGALANVLSCADGGATRELGDRVRLLEVERSALRERVDDLVAKREASKAMAGSRVRIGVPTSLALKLVEKAMTGFFGEIDLELGDLHVKRSGEVRKFVTLGSYSLDVDIQKVKARLKTQRPDLAFGESGLSLAVSVRVASGDGRAQVHFTWEGRALAETVCGDLDITRDVSGTVDPETYPVRGRLGLSTTSREIIVTPHLPEIVVRLHITPSEDSWRAIKAVLDEKEGVCGFVLDRVDVLGLVKTIIDRGFAVRLPTEKLAPLGVPIGLAPQVTVRGKVVTLKLSVAGLAISDRVLWLGAQASVLKDKAPPTTGGAS